MGLSIVGCSPLPQAPSLDVSFEDYEHPSGTLSPKTIDEAWLQLAAASATSRSLPSLAFLEDTVFGPLRDAEGDFFAQFVGDGFANIEAECPGPATPASGIEGAVEPGKVQATVRFKNRLQSAMAWGVAEGCRFEALEQIGEISGPFVIEAHDDHLLIWLSSTLRFGDEVVLDNGASPSARFSFHVRLSADRMERLIQLQNRTLVYFREIPEDAEQIGRQGLIDSHQEWSCIVSELRCYDQNLAALSPTPSTTNE